MRTEDKVLVRVILLIMVIVLAVRSWFGGADYVRAEAVQAGTARWVADENGEPKFEWITPPGGSRGQ